MAFLVLLAAVLLVLSAQANAGFLSIDCGLDDEYSGYKDPNSGGIVYVSDGTYTDAGENLKVAPEYESYYQSHFLRSYLTYLARLAASYGNHDGRNDSSAMEFDVHLGANYWDTVRVRDNQVYEVVFVAWAGWAPVCLLNTGHGAPFLSMLELRRLGDALYPALMANQTMSMFRRRNMGGKFIRFPDDPYDRYWWTIVDPRWSNLSTAQNMQPDPSFAEPVVVLQTAATATGNSTALSYTWQDNRPAYSFMVFLHFADFQSAQLREFDIYFNGNRLGPSDKPYRPPYLASSTVCSFGWYRATDGN
ncbi:putative LRR receptor-like serine/threonine-protein kinase PAM74 [Panicum miliaceum]|uniref:LRR receptor-like serine/threonine-protein kinase PAM74 n=1 Tax=Panicum miliaceum TaxID=4540 RepID=A0A3L6T9G9_PANMI|nr:putative LRR receptor-like serine/threonine-protein kinase PAM74 [Panicum miliaceum]